MRGCSLTTGKAAAGKFALVTGASAGIGVAFARLAASKGYDVGLVARRADRLEALAAELRAGHSVDALPIAADLCETTAPETIAARLEREGRPVDVLVNNAGYSLKNSFAATSLADHRRFIELTVTTPVALAHLFLKGMLARGWGRIINISSITAFSTGGKGHTLYPAGKSFLVKFSQSLSAEVAERGVKVTAVCPGFVDTEFQSANEIADQMGRTPAFMIQSPEDIAAESWRRNEAGAEVVVPGFLPKVAAAFLHYAPEQIVTPMTRRAAAQHFSGE